MLCLHTILHIFLEQKSEHWKNPAKKLLLQFVDKLKDNRQKKNILF